MKKNRPALRAITLIGATLAIAASFQAQQQPALYGSPIPLEKAKQVAAVAIAEAQKNAWPMAVTVVDTAGDLVFFEKMDGTQLGSIQVSQDKARSAVFFKRPTKAFEDALAAGGIGLRILKLPGAMPVEGGIPLIENGKIIGAIGVSGGQSLQDGQCATAAAATIH
jgi:glc operon protein GlcG